jgi:hypothetical protein
MGTAPRFQEISMGFWANATNFLNFVPSLADMISNGPRVSPMAGLEEVYVAAGDGVEKSVVICGMVSSETYSCHKRRTVQRLKMIKQVKTTTTIVL